MTNNYKKELPNFFNKKYRTHRKSNKEIVIKTYTHHNQISQVESN